MSSKIFGKKKRKAAAEAATTSTPGGPVTKALDPNDPLALRAAKGRKTRNGAGPAYSQTILQSAASGRLGGAERLGG